MLWLRRTLKPSQINAQTLNVRISREWVNYSLDLHLSPSEQSSSMSSPSQERETTPIDAEIQERARVNNVLETMMGDLDEEESDNDDVRLEWLMNGDSAEGNAAMEEVWVDDDGAGEAEFYDDAEYLEDDE